MKIIQKFRVWYRWAFRFVTHDMWESGTRAGRSALAGIVKRLYLTTRIFFREELSFRASALTYSSLLSVVPILAIVFAIAKGFGLVEFTEQWIRSNIVAKPEFIDTLVGFVQSYLNHTQGGIFLGFGFIMLLWTLISLTDSIETAFNVIWQVDRPRSIFRMLTDYTAIFFLLPIFIVVSSGLTIFIYSAASQYVPDVLLLRPVALFLVQLLPYLIVCLFFSGLFAFMPNTHVKVSSALKAGIPTGILFQLLQIGYVHSQMWLTSYNAIYGSFAALPLFMLLCQIAWMLVLFGGTLCYVDQNIHSFYYGHDDVRLSRLDHDCLSIRLVTTICRRFARAETPLTAAELADIEKLHLRIVTELLSELTRAGVIMAISDDGKNTGIKYVPASDIHRITVVSLLETLDRIGENIHPNTPDEWIDFCKKRRAIFGESFSQTPLHLVPESAVKKP